MLKKPAFQIDRVEDQQTRFHFDQIRLWVERLHNTAGDITTTPIAAGIVDVQVGPFTIRLYEIDVPIATDPGYNPRFVVPGNIFQMGGVYVAIDPATDLQNSGVRNIRPSRTESSSGGLAKGLRFNDATASLGFGGFREFGLLNEIVDRIARAKIYVVYIKDGAF